MLLVAIETVVSQYRNAEYEIIQIIYSLLFIRKDNSFSQLQIDELNDNENEYYYNPKDLRIFRLEVKGRK